jgi:lysozyme family protein
MASFQHFAPHILAYEGGYVNDLNGTLPTNKGIILPVWKRHGYDKNGSGSIDVRDLAIISDQDALRIYKKRYWDILQADLIKHQSIAEILVDFAVNAGSKRAIGTAEFFNKIPANKTISQAEIDKLAYAFYANKFSTFGTLPVSTIESLNRRNPFELFPKILNLRSTYYKLLAAKRPAVFQPQLRGWLNRLEKLERPTGTPQKTRPTTSLSRPNNSSNKNTQLAAISGFSLIAGVFLVSNFLNQTNQTL